MTKYIFMLLCRFTGSHTGELYTGTCFHCHLDVLHIKAKKVGKGQNHRKHPLLNNNLLYAFCFLTKPHLLDYFHSLNNVVKALKPGLPHTF